MSNVAKLGERLAVRLHGVDTPALGFITHVNENDADGRASVDLVAFPHGELHPRVATGVPVYDTEEDLLDAADDDPKNDAPHVAAFWPTDMTGSDVKPPKVKRTPRKATPAPSSDTPEED